MVTILPEFHHEYNKYFETENKNLADFAPNWARSLSWSDVLLNYVIFFMLNF